MSTLGPEARALVDAARRSLRSKAGDRERIEAALRAHLGNDALPPNTGVTQVGTATSWQAVTGAAVGLLFVAGVALYALRPTGAPEPDPHAATPPPAPQTTPADPHADAPSAVPDPAAPEQTPSSPRPRARDDLAHEVELLSRATGELRADRPAAALEVLADHQRRFPAGALVEERRAAKAQALCLMGRVREGRAELSQLTPRSPAAATAQRVCEGAADVKP